MDALGDNLWQLLRAAWLLPLVSFTIIVFGGKRLGKAGVLAGYLATGAIVGAFVLSMTAFGLWLNAYGVPTLEHHGGEHHAQLEPADSAFTLASSQEAAPAEAPHADEAGHAVKPNFHAGEWYRLAEFGNLKASISYHIDALTICMFCMVTLIASCIHFYAMGYMHDELHDITDHEVHLHDGHHLHRPGRYYRFFQYLSLFCFSMLGIVIAAPVLYGAGRLAQRLPPGLLPEASLEPMHWAILAIPPLAAALIAMATARFTVIRTLGRMP